MKELTVRTNAGQIAVVDSEGSGFPCLMIHGNSSCKEVFRNQLDGDIGKEFRCIAIDLPGHGNSSDAVNPAKDYTMPGYAATAAEVMAQLGYNRYGVLGWSLGGHVGIEMIPKVGHDGPMMGLMISGTPPVGLGAEAVGEGFVTSEHMHLAAQAELSDEEVDAYAHATCGRNAPFEDFLREAVARTDGRARKTMFDNFMAGHGSNQRGVTVNSPIPVAIVNGSEDEFVNNEYIRSLDYKNLWEGRVYDLSGIGHAPFWEAPDQFDPYLRRFLHSLAAS